MVSASCTRLLFLHFCWSLTVASDNFNEIKIQQSESNVLRISCDVINGPSDSLPIQMSIFADTPNNTLVSVLYEKCPKVQDSAKDKHIYLPKCVPHEETMSLDIVLINYNPHENQTFGCNYTCVVDSDRISDSLSFATVNSPENSSPTASNECPVAQQGSPEDNEIGQLEGNVLRISCGVINGASDSNPIQMSIFEDTPNNTLISMVYETCPRVQDSGKDKHIHQAKCVQNGENIFMDTVLANYNLTGKKHFGCNYMYLVGEGQTSNSVPLASVSSPGTPSSTVRDDSSTVVHGGTCGRHDTYLVVIIVLAVLNCLLLLLIILHKYKVCWKNGSKHIITYVNCTRAPSSGKTPQAESKMEYSKQDEQDDINPCITINKTENSGADAKLTLERLRILFRSATSLPENVTGEEEYQEDNPYTQDTKLPIPETGVDIPLMDG